MARSYSTSKPLKESLMLEVECGRLSGSYFLIQLLTVFKPTARRRKEEAGEREAYRWWRDGREMIVSLSSVSPPTSRMPPSKEIHKGMRDKES